MKLTPMKFAGLLAGVALTFGPACVYAAESHMAQALKHAQAAAKATEGATISEHAQKALDHAKAADEHLDAGVVSLDGAIEQVKQGHADLAKKSAQEAAAHLKAAQ